MQRIVLRLTNIPDRELTLENLLSATQILFPFRLNTGSLFQIIDPDNVKNSLWVRNKVSIPNNASSSSGLTPEYVDAIHGDPKRLLTEALIVSPDVIFSDSEFIELQAGRYGRLGPARPPSFAVNLINEAIIAHQLERLGPYISALGGIWPSKLSDRQFYSRIVRECILVIERDKTLDKADVENIFNAVDRMPSELSDIVIGDLFDYSDEQLSKLCPSIRKIRKHAFYELKTSAVSAALIGDMYVAIILACAALEGAHGAYLRSALKGDFDGTDKEYNRYLDSLLREQGFYALLQLSCRTLLPQEKRPGKEDIESCLSGVIIRNAIMHAGQRKTGEYKLRDYSQSEISKGYSGILNLFKVFTSLVEEYENN